MSNDNLTFLENKPTIKHVSILGIPIDIGKDNVGTDQGPEHLRKHGLLEMLSAIRVTHADLGDVNCPTRESAHVGDKKVKYLKEIVEVSRRVASTVEREVGEKHLLIALGGDHSLSLGTFAGALAATKGDLGIIYIDAHGDIHTDDTSPSGNIHGMMVAAALGEGHEELVQLFSKKLKPENFIYVGLKDLEQGEIDLIRKKKLSTETIIDLADHGLSQTFAKIKGLQSRVKSIWVSLDLDSIDQEYAPATPIINTGGLTYREITSLAKFIGKTCNLVGFDIVELQPSRDKEEKTTKLAIELIATLLGAEYNWYTSYMAHEEEKQAARK
jgi:arginase